VAIDLLGSAVGRSGLGGLAAWNDAPGRTQAEIVAAFAAAVEMETEPEPEAMILAKSKQRRNLNR
jgi:hypothetical protein